MAPDSEGAGRWKPAGTAAGRQRGGLGLAYLAAIGTVFFLAMGVVFLAQGRATVGAVVMLVVGLLGVFITIAAVRSVIRHRRDGW